jgi:hypothetical protein
MGGPMNTPDVGWWIQPADLPGRWFFPVVTSTDHYVTHAQPAAPFWSRQGDVIIDKLDRQEIGLLHQPPEFT